MTEVIPAGFSIVVCTFNGKKRLSPTIEHLAKLKIPDNFAIELIVVDNASDDNTSAFVTDKWKSLKEPFTLKLYHEERPGKGYAVETGYDAARYSFIVTVDDDNWLDEDYLINTIKIFESDPNIGVLQGKSIGVYETSPPDWMNEFGHYFVIGGPMEKPGYFSKHNFYVRGAGMVILNSDWLFLRKRGFSFFTSKTTGKTAGEDNETALGILLLGKTIYYSDQLTYKHFMPKERIKWSTLEGNFAAFGVGSYYFYLYFIMLNSLQDNYVLNASVFKKRFIKMWLRELKQFGVNKNIGYLASGKKKYRLELKSTYYKLRTFLTSGKNIEKDLTLLKSWIIPVINDRSGGFPLNEIM